MSERERFSCRSLWLRLFAARYQQMTCAKWEAGKIARWVEKRCGDRVSSRRSGGAGFRRAESEPRLCRNPGSCGALEGTNLPAIRFLQPPARDCLVLICRGHGEPGLASASFRRRRSPLLLAVAQGLGGIRMRFDETVRRRRWRPLRTKCDARDCPPGRPTLAGVHDDGEVRCSFSAAATASRRIKRLPGVSCEGPGFRTREARRSLDFHEPGCTRPRQPFLDAFVHSHARKNRFAAWAASIEKLEVLTVRAPI